MTYYDEENIGDNFGEEYLDDFDSETMASFVKAASKSASTLTKIIVENHRYNHETMTSEDIYQIYLDSFSVAMSAIANEVDSFETDEENLSEEFDEQDKDL